MQQDSECSFSGMDELVHDGRDTVRDANSVGGLLQHVDNVRAITCSFCKLAVVGSSIDCYQCRAEFHADPHLCWY